MVTGLCIVYWITVFWGCSTSSSVVENRCAVEVQPLSTTAEKNTPLQIQAYPLTTTFDTIVYWNDIPVQPSSIDTSPCDACATCQTENSCAMCDLCVSCTSTCDSCWHTMEILVPSDSPASVFMTIYNVYGSSDAMEIQVLDTQETDSGN